MEYVPKTRWVYHAFALIVVVLLFVFRLADLGDNPKGFYCDEASIAYNARCLIDTGRDEHGAWFPIFPKAFGEYKSGPFIYVTALSVKVFGNTHFAARLPSAVLLSLALIFGYLLMARKFHPLCGVVTVVLMGCQPWFNHFSHVSFELVIVPLWLSAAFLCWIQAVNGRPANLMPSALFFGFAFYSYPPARVFVVLLVVALVFIYRKNLFGDTRQRKAFKHFVMIAMVMAVPFCLVYFTQEDFTSRLAYLSIFETPFYTLSSGYKWLQGSFPNTSFEDSWQTRLAIVLYNYFAYLEPGYLFFNGDYNLQYGTNRYGNMNIISMVGMLLWLISLWVHRSRFDLSLLAWLLLYPVAAAFTWEAIPHSGRGIVGHPGLDLIAASGLWKFGRFLRYNLLVDSLWIKRIAPAVFATLAFGLFGLDAYGYHLYHRSEYSRDAAQWMQYGVQDVMQLIRDRHHRYDEVVMINNYLHYMNYVFALYYAEHPPADWQTMKSVPWKIREIKTSLENYPFQEKTLYVISAQNPYIRHDDLRLVGKVNWEDRESAAFVLYEYHPQTGFDGREKALEITERNLDPRGRGAGRTP